MTTADDLFNDEIAGKIQNMLRLCSVRRASVSFRFIAAPPNTDCDRILAWEIQGGETHTSLVSSPTDRVFHIGSITKILVATAIVHAIEVKALEDANNNRWSRFENIGSQSIKKVYDEYKRPTDPELPFLPGEPTVYEFIVHSKGLPSRNDILLAPDGTPLMDLREVPGCLPTLFQEVAGRDESRRWTSYSNMNFAVIALLIEVLWNGPLEHFMERTLFEPLNMRSTSIGFPTNRSTASSRWTVDQYGTLRQVSIPEYGATGAEAAAFGAYSTAQDLDIFFSSVIQASHYDESSTTKGLSSTVETLLGMKNKYIDEVLHYTPFGLHTKLSGSTIGLLSTNGLQYPDERCTTYPVVPGSLGKKYSIHYMAGSAVGCCCATALCAGTTEDFAVTVLTDTTGPVGVADHILRLVLRKHVDLQNPIRSLLSTRDSVTEMVAQTMKNITENWKEKEEEDQRLRSIACTGPFDIEGIFDAAGFPQRLHVVKKSDGKTYLAISGITTPARSGEFELVWKDDAHLWLCVPAYMSIDRLDNGDWSDVLFEVTRDASGTVELKRKKEDGTEDRYIRRA